MKGIIVFYSTYGSTKQYAEWISEEIGFPTFSTKDKNIPYGESEIVVVGSPTLMMKPFLSKWIVKHWDILMDKKVVLYTTSGTLPTDTGLQEGFRDAVPDEIRNIIDYFPLHGRMIFKNLSRLHKMMMGIAQMKEKDPVVKAEIKKDVDGVKRENIAEIVAFIKDRI